MDFKSSRAWFRKYSTLSLITIWITRAVNIERFSLLRFVPTRTPNRTLSRKTPNREARQSLMKIANRTVNERNRRFPQSDHFVEGFESPTPWERIKNAKCSTPDCASCLSLNPYDEITIKCIGAKFGLLTNKIREIYQLYLTFIPSTGIRL